VIPAQPLRLWPGIAAAAVLLVMGGVSLIVPSATMAGLVAGFVSTGTIVLWWLFLSRAPWVERIAAIAAMVLAAIVMRPLIDRSIVGGGMGALMYILAAPSMALALVAWAAGTRRFGTASRRASLPVAMLLACGLLTLLRTDGIGGEGILELRWRWTPTAEERLLARREADPVVPAPASAVETPPAPAIAAAAEQPAASDTAAAAPEPIASGASGRPAAAPAEWPGFRGPNRDGVVRGVRIDTDWASSPPAQLWRRPIGPGWSSFAVDGDLLYTQEQRGDDEIVACYRVSTGEPVWRHRDPVRFWESNGGAGPRGTPTLDNGRVYALGATGVLNALDARTGAVLWSRHAASDTKVAVPTWGFSSSPLVVDGVVIVATDGTLAGYDLDTGMPRWIGTANGSGYSSPHLVTIDGEPQVLLLSGTATSVSPADGAVLWQHAWAGGAIVQPAVTPDGDILINALGVTGGMGIRRLTATRGPDGWTVEERWTSNGLKPYFNDFVVHGGHAFGFDGSILAGIDLADGRRAWKGGRYGAGQMILLADQHLLLVVSEEGDLALVGATPEGFSEIARAPGIEGKTWNHPVVVGDILLVRNGQEMAAFRLPLANR
jgi:outer membrane protein assembly factor BamB